MSISTCYCSLQSCFQALSHSRSRLIFSDQFELLQLAAVFRYLIDIELAELFKTGYGSNGVAAMLQFCDVDLQTASKRHPR
ncbi:MAG: hypothetical protein HC767_08700 [Akkermansiaceae bacterium]|nr:hypothetical protein [Akkermansiaceae bacterium]